MSNQIENHYLKIDKDLLRKYPNKSYNKTLITVPFRLLIIGPSGSGKSNVLIDLLHKQNGMYENVIFCVKNKAEPLYEQIQKKAPDVKWFENQIPSPDLEEYKTAGPSLIIFDDVCCNKNQKVIEQWFIRGRKLGNKKTGYHSCIYLSQSAYLCPKPVRDQCNYLILKKLGSKRDIDLILREYVHNIDIDKQTLKEMYNYCVNGDKFSFMKIDIDNNHIYKNWTEKLD